MKQSLRLWLPRLNELTKFNDFISGKFPANEQKFICHCQNYDLPLLKNLYVSGKNVTVLIGPEGDFTPEEINLAEAKDFIPAGLGKSRLRTETAGIVAVATVQLLNE